MSRCKFDVIGKRAVQCRYCGRKLGTPVQLPVIVETCVSRGLGDTLAKAFAALGIKPCGGCKERQNKLNEWISYR